MFKHTGIIRRIDDIGRIVIPKEVRRRFRIGEGDPIEIGEDGDFIALRKYSVVELGGDIVRKILHSFAKTTHKPVILCSTTHVLKSFRIGMKTPDYLTVALSNAVRDAENSCVGHEITYTSKIKVKAIERIWVDGVIEGALIIPQSDECATISASDSACLKLCANAIAEVLK